MKYINGSMKYIGSQECFKKDLTSLNGITEITASVDTAYSWKIIEHEGKKYAIIDGESKNGIISKNVHELDSGKIIHCEEATKEWSKAMEEIKASEREFGEVNRFTDTLLSKI